MAVRRETIEYRSSADGTGPLYADVAFIDDGVRRPLLAVMHGYGGSRGAVSLDVDELAAQGVVAVAPDMRGRGGSGGEWDSGGLDIHDIVDALLAAVKQFPDQIDAANINIVGYSGGGGNAIAAGCRFPDLFNTSVSFFGIPDYGGWYESRGRPDCNEWMEAAIGTPTRFPARFEARNMIPAAGNATRTKWWLFWDIQEKDCPAHFVDKWMAVCGRAGGAFVRAHVTRPGDAKRWVHNYRSNNRDLTAADPLFLPDVFTRPESGVLSLPVRGELVVPGYVVTRRFSVFLGDGTEGMARVRYRLDGPRPVVEVIDNPRGTQVNISYDSLTAALP
ncbi:MAG: prolyl oligopeptidase family serine peptidase [Planctomycetes bacterium]|nr:prolyl oligopeptidase family serine peptidase [Planctomycetota bacterium]